MIQILENSRHILILIKNLTNKINHGLFRFLFLLSGLFRPFCFSYSLSNFYLALGYLESSFFNPIRLQHLKIYNDFFINVLRQNAMNLHLVPLVQVRIKSPCLYVFNRISGHKFRILRTLWTMGWWRSHVAAHVVDSSFNNIKKVNNE